MSKKWITSLPSLQKKLKIFLSYMNTWFSKEFRTSSSSFTKIINTFMGTINLSIPPLPHLFEPHETKIKIGDNYN